MRDFVTVSFYILFGFLSGSIFYCRLVPMLLVGKDVCALSDDKNPGAANVFIHCGVPMGLFCLALDMANGAVPVALALRVLDPVRLSFAAVMAAPVLGHALGVLNGGRGGKCIAVIFGVLIALLGITPMGWVLAGIYIFFAGVLRVRPNSKCSILTFALFAACALGMGIVHRQYALALGAVALSAISIVKHSKSAAALRAAAEEEQDAEAQNA